MSSFLISNNGVGGATCVTTTEIVLFGLMMLIQFQCRIARNELFTAQEGIFLTVDLVWLIKLNQKRTDLGNANGRIFIGQLIGGPLPLGCQLLAMAAPWRVELD